MPVLSRLLRQERVPSFRTSPTDPGIPMKERTNLCRISTLRQTKVDLTYVLL